MLLFENIKTYDNDCSLVWNLEINLSHYNAVISTNRSRLDFPHDDA